MSIRATLTAIAAVLIATAVPGFTVNPPVNFPPPTEWNQPAGAPSAPGDAYSATFGTSTPAANAPVIAEWTRIAKPDETVTFTGAKFTSRTGVDAGTDTTIWLYAWTPDGGVMRQCKVWKLYSDNIIMASIPEDVPFGMYLVWAENEAGTSAPVCINKTQTEWVGTLGPYAAPGQTKRIFGKNISTNHGTAASHVYIRPAAGGSFTECTWTQVEPVSVAFTVPSDTPAGSYKVYVHNGHGGQYGWSDALDLTVSPSWVRGAGELSVIPSGGNDTPTIQGAIDTVSGYTGGGTVRLTNGTFNCSGTLKMKDGVRLIGAGRTQTTLLFSTSGAEFTFNQGANHVTVQDLTIKAGPGINISTHSEAVHGGAINSDLTLKNIDWLLSSDTVSSIGMYYAVDRFEVDNCTFYGVLAGDGRDWWIHNNTLYGGRGADDGCMALLQGTGNPHGRYVIENNAASTLNWPNNSGNRNYHEYMTEAQKDELVWCARFIFFQMGADSYENSYISHNTTQDVAIEDNKGETILFHSSESYRYCQVASNSERTLTIRTDGTFDGDPNFRIYDTAPFTTVPNGWGWGSIIDNRAYVIIVAGTGVGQIRKIASHTSTTITVDSDWRVQPAADSKIILDYINRNHIQYANVMNALPVGYVFKSHIASYGVNYDGGSFGCVAEDNTSYRTAYGDGIQGYMFAPSMWNEMRNGRAINALASGQTIAARAGYDSNNGDPNYVNCVGAVTLGNFFHGGRSEGKIDSQTIPETKNSNSRQLVGNAFDGLTVTNGGGFSGNLDDTLYRNNSFSVPVESACMTLAQNSQAMLCGNTYTGGYVRYSVTSPSAAPAAPYRVARFTGYTGSPVGDIIVPIANLGTALMSWSATPSAPWISASAASGGSTPAESELDRLMIGVNTTGLTQGRHWGYVNIVAGAKSTRIGVVLDLVDGPATNQAPIAAFTTTPTAGTHPLVVSFNAGGSIDSDGLLTSYAWDFGDGTKGTGQTASHTYQASGSFFPTLMVTDNDGASNATFSVLSVSPTLTSVTLSGSPTPPIDAGTSVTFTATSIGGYQPRYKFLVKTASGWTTIQDYSSSNTCLWTPTAGFYDIKCYAKSSDSTKVYDAVSSVLSYPVGLLPSSGMAFWLKGDAGVSASGGKMNEWADQTSGSTKKLTQATPSYKPTLVDAALNGRSVVRFAGGYACMSTNASVLAQNTDFTAFTLARITNAPPYSNYQYLWWIGPDSPYTGYGMWMSTNGRLRSSWGSQNGIVTTSSAPSAGTWHTVVSRYTPGAHEMWLDGTQLTTATKADSNLTVGFTAGNSPSLFQGFAGDLAEVLIFSRKLTNTEKTGVEQYLSSRWTAPVPTSLDRLRDVLALGDGVTVSITSAKVAVNPSGIYSDGSVYVIESDRTCGLKVTGAGSVNIGDTLTLSGTTDTDVTTGERVLRVSLPVNKGEPTELGSLGLLGKSFSATGQLVRVWGRVKETTASYLTLDDGSGATTKVQIDGLATALATIPAIGDYISATGPAGMIAGSVPAVRVRFPSDIAIY